MGKRVDVKGPSIPKLNAPVWLYNANYFPGSIVLLFPCMGYRLIGVKQRKKRFELDRFPAHNQLFYFVKTRAIGSLYLDKTYSGVNHDVPTK